MQDNQEFGRYALNSSILTFECARAAYIRNCDTHQLGNGRAHLIAMRSEPLPGVIVILILKAHSNAIAAIAPA